MVWEGMPAGDYILEEIETPPGYLTNQIEVEIQETSKLQLITMQEDHIKTAFFNYDRVWLDKFVHKTYGKRG